VYYVLFIAHSILTMKTSPTLAQLHQLIYVMTAVRCTGLVPWPEAMNIPKLSV